LKPGGIRTPGFVAYPSRGEAIRGEVQGQMLEMYDLTDAQYDSLIKLTATLCSVLDRIECDYPRDDARKLVTRKLDDARLAGYHGVLGHFHVQSNKIDPGPAFDWDRVIEGARREMRKNKRR
jgi:N-acetyl-anhydromuramyl-L-alanine amidase AmpD